MLTFFDFFGGKGKVQEQDFNLSARVVIASTVGKRGSGGDACTHLSLGSRVTVKSESTEFKFKSRPGQEGS